MISAFIFENTEIATRIGVDYAIERRIPERSWYECEVKPATITGFPMKRRLPCRIRIYAGYDGEPPYVSVLGDSATARDLYRAIRSNGRYCVDAHI